jgi:hypothetical protein
MKNPSLRSLLSLALALLGAAAVRADRIELIDGSVVMGKLVSAEDHKFKVETAFAGTILIAQDKIKCFSTDEAVNVSLSAGSTMLGKVTATDNGIAVAAADGQMAAGTAKVAAVWRAGGDSPETRAAKELAEKTRRHWAYEASVAIAGRTGVSEKFGGNVGFKATLVSAQDKLIFALAAERARDNGVETANREFGGVDYSSFFSPDNGWYARTSLEKDEIKALDLRSTTAFGFGRKLIKTPKQDLEFRMGVSYLYEAYSNNTNFSSPGLDVALLHTFTFTNAKLTNTITYTPAFKDFSNYRVHHESGFELPLALSQWKLKLGVANDYQSVPPPGTKRLDTTYFTSLLLNWE